MTVWRNTFGTEKLKIGELAERAGVTKRTIDHYTNLGLLQAERSSSNYRFYPLSAIDDIQLIEQGKKDGLTLEQIKIQLIAQNAVEIDVRELRLKIKGLEQEVTNILAQMEKSDSHHHETLKKNVKTESLSLVQALVLLLNS